MNAGPFFPMKVLITTQVFPPETHPSALMVEELAEDLAQRGIEVAIATGFPHHPYGRLYPGYSREWIKVEDKKCFRVVRGWHLIHHNHTFLVRTLVMASQSIAFFLSAAKTSRADVVISYGPPLLGPLTSSIIARTLRAKLVTVIYDIYPDIAIELGQLRNPAVIKLARKFERFIFLKSDRIVVLSEGFRRTLIEEKRVAPEKIAVIPVWLDVRDIVPMGRDNSWRRQMGIEPEKFVVLYAGTIGLVSGAEVVVEAARRLESYPDLVFLFVGAGYAKDRVEAEAISSGLKNICFLPFQSRERLSEVQATADISLVTLAPGRGKTSVPSKVIGYMAAARPVVAAVDEGCDTAELIRNSGCGAVVPPGQGGLLAEAILHLYANPEERLTRGEAGHRHFLQHFERRAVLTRFIETIQNVFISSRGTT